MPVAGYIKHLVLKDVADMDYPTFQISAASEKRALKALKEKGRAKKVTNVSEYLRRL